jgi:DsbC/DsbD-like thiol-disulfide interchange protein/cytochrome c biogenesis protein CcdA
MDRRMRSLNGFFMTFWMLLLALLGATGANAQAGGAFMHAGPAHIRTSLIAETAKPAPGSKVTLALMMQPDKGWHGYWQNPGDAGVGLTIDWDLPANVTASPFRYPVPQRLLISGLMNHVYEHDYALLFDISVPPGVAVGTTLPIRGTAHWLACTDSICVPEQGTVETVLTVGDGKIAAGDRTRFDGLRAQLPRPLDQEAHYRQSGDRITIAVPYPAGVPVGEPWFFAETQQRIKYAQPQTIKRDGDMLIVETRVPEGAPAVGPIDGVLAVSPTVALAISAMPGAVPSGGMVISSGDLADSAPAPFSMAGFLVALGGAFLGGLILNIMPCVFPILSLKAISLAKAGGDERKVRAEALAYTGGILLTCLALGALMLGIKAGGTQIGWAFQLQDPRVIALLLVVMVAITLNLAGFFEIGTISVGQGKAGQGGMGGAFWTGALAAFVATPCSGPFMATAMGAALVLPWPLALTVFAGLAVGLALPFLAIAYVPTLRRMMPRPGNWMNIFRKVMAVPMALTALALVWLLSRQLGSGGIVLGVALALGVALLTWLIGQAQRAGKGMNWALGGVLLLAIGTVAVAAPAYVRTEKVADTDLAGTPFNAAKLAELRGAKKPVFLYFTADWCLTCKVNEANAIESGKVHSAFEKAGVETMVGDWTNADPAITRFLEANGRAGVPLYLYYAPGAPEPQVLPQVLTPDTLVALAKS